MALWQEGGMFPLPRLDKTQNVRKLFKPKLALSRAVQRWWQCCRLGRPSAPMLAVGSAVRSGRAANRTLSGYGVARNHLKRLNASACRSVEKVISKPIRV